MQPLTEKYRPTRLQDFAGMDKARAILGHLANEPYSSAWLLVGPSGTGKTTMALALAEKIGAEVVHVPSKECDLARVQEIAMRCHYTPMFGGWGYVIVIDECDQMTNAAQLAFLSVLDTTGMPPNTVFVFTANDTAKLQDRFLSRCRTIKFSTDGMLQPTIDLLTRVWQAESSAPLPDIKAIVEAAKCNVRQALMDLELEILSAIAYKPAPVAPKRRGYMVGDRWVIATA